ncbi:MAG: glycosyltransferase family 92 protein [Sphingobacteriaceae bacterium]|nr:MAG: glycosyltransferase family 92 protein [Sphingobacteriaceae bacterium]
MLKKLLGLKRGNKFKYKVAICCIVKDEDPYLIEWVNYHQKIGVDQFFIYDNGSKNAVADILSHYIDEGIVRVDVLKGKAMQMPAYKQCLTQYGALCRWIAFIDIDEFIVPKTLTGSLPDFLAAYENYGGLGINWLVFGSNGHTKKQQGQIQSYTKRTLKSNLINGHIKSIVQPQYVKTGVSNPHHFPYKKGQFCVNENFERIDSAIVSHTSNQIQLNHYNLRSLDEFKEKVLRGRSDIDLPRHIDYFDEHDKDANVITDESIIELQMIIDHKQ